MLVGWVLSQPAWADTEALKIGLLPTLSPRVLLKDYEYLRGYLARELQQPVSLATATDFSAFHRQASEGQYDLVVTAAHFARLLQREQGWIPLATYKMANQALLVVKKNSVIQNVEDVRGQAIASADPLALLVIQTKLWLQEQGLEQGRDYRMVQTSSFTSAAFAITQNQAALTILSPSSYRQIPDEIRRDLKIFRILPEIQAITWMLHPRRANMATRIQQSLLHFTADSVDGREFFQLTGYKGLREVSAEQMRSMDPYADMAKPLLNIKR